MTLSDLQDHSAVADLFRRNISYNVQLLRISRLQTGITISQVTIIKNHKPKINLAKLFKFRVSSKLRSPYKWRRCRHRPPTMKVGGHHAVLDNDMHLPA